VKEHNLQKGDELEMSIDTNDNILLSMEPISSSGLKEVHIEISKNDKIYVRSLLGSAYRKGFDKLYLTFNDPDIYKKIVEASNSLMGYEVIDFDRNKCIIKNMILEESSEFEVTLRKIITSLKWMNTLMMDDIKKKKFDSLEEFNNIRLNMWRLRDYALRIVAKKNIFRSENFNYSILVWVLEKITDQYRKMYDTILVDKNKNYSHMLPLLQKYGSFIEIMEKAYYKKDISVIPEFDEYYSVISKKSFELFNSNKHNNLFISYVLENNKRIHDLKSFLVMIILDAKENVIDSVK